MKTGLLALCIVTALAFMNDVRNVAGQTDPAFQGIQVLTNKEVRLQLSTVPGQNYRIDVSTMLPQWQPLITLTGVTTSLQHTDSAAPYLDTRFYRAEQISGPDILTGDYLTTTNGNVIFHPVGHASFVFSWEGLMIYNDPTNGAPPYAGFPRADLILISHNHGDHFSASTIDSVRDPNGMVIAPLQVYSSLTTAQRAFTGVLTNGMTTNVFGLHIEALPAYNGNHPRGNGNGYVLTIGGKRIFIPGDTGDIAEIRALQNIDVAFLCINSFTMSVTDAVNSVRAFRPKVVYPYHYRNSVNPPSYADLIDFKRRVGQDLGIEVRLRKWY